MATDFAVFLHRFLTAQLEERRGSLVGAMVVRPTDELFAITSTGVVIRVSVEPVRPTKRATMGVKLITLAAGSTVSRPFSDSRSTSGTRAAPESTSASPGAGSSDR